MEQWSRGEHPTVDWGCAWAMTRVILTDRGSYSFAALSGWTYAPSGTEQALWDINAGRAKYRPWTDRVHDPLRPPHQVSMLSESQRADREKLKRFFHIEDD